MPSSSGSAVGHVGDVQLDQRVGQVAPGVRARPRTARPRGCRPGSARWRWPWRWRRTRCPARRPAAGGDRVVISASASIAQPVITSVSGRGTNTPGPTSTVDPAEVRPAGQVLQRHPLGPPVDQRGEPPDMIIVELGRAAAAGPARPRRRRRAGSGRPGPPTRTPAAVSRSVAADSSGRTGWLTGAVSPTGRQPLGGVGLLQGLDHRGQVAVQHLVQVVGLEPDPVVGDPVLREVVGADPLRAVDRAHLAAPGGGGGVGRLLLGQRR